MTTHHIPERDLALLASDPDAIDSTRSREIHAHLAACADCADTYDTFVVTFAGEDDDAFLASAGSVASMEYGDRLARENAEAEELLKDYFDEPEKVAYRNLAAQRKFLHGGVVRRLAKQANDVCAKDALHALVFADAAIAMAEALPKDSYPPNALHDMRGRAWKERANALNQLGEPVAALDALDHAKREYDQVPSGNTLGLGNVALVRGAVYFYMERLADADREVQIAEELYERLGDAERSTKALFLRGNIRYQSHELEGAATLFRRVIAYGEAQQDEQWIASGSYALGNCVLDTGDIASAADLFGTALRIYRRVAEQYVVNAEWGMGRVLLARGLFPESLRRLNAVHAEFTRREMVLDAAVSALDAMDAMVALRMFKQIGALAREVFTTFSDAGMLTSALTALAFIQTAAAEERLTRSQVQAVRTFVKRLEREPDLLFVPPPDAPR